MRKKLAFLLGTRPEVIKLAPLIVGGQRDGAFEVTVISSGQHDEMLRQALAVFGIEPAYDLALMTREQTLTDITVRVLGGLEPLLPRIAPDLLIVQGDTTTAFAGALAAFYQKIPVAHVEAGLRTWQRDLPFPEEMNRAMIASLAELHFAPTPGARENLLACGVAPEKIFVTGNTVIDALLSIDEGEEVTSLLAPVPAGAPVVLATAHRREHHGPPLEEIARAIRRIVETHPEVHLFFSLHRSPAVRRPVERILSALPRIHLLEPLDYRTFVGMMRRCRFILTDSGGIQEEAPALGKPVLVLRSRTERPEGIEAGGIRVVGIEAEEIVAAARELLEDTPVYHRMARVRFPYGDGRAAPRILEAIRAFFAGSLPYPPDWEAPP